MSSEHAAELSALSAVDLVDAYRRQALSPVDVVRAVLQHNAAWERTCTRPTRWTPRRR
jgi:hypothetical protein